MELLPFQRKFRNFNREFPLKEHSGNSPGVALYNKSKIQTYVCILIYYISERLFQIKRGIIANFFKRSFFIVIFITWFCNILNLKNNIIKPILYFYMYIFVIIYSIFGIKLYSAAAKIPPENLFSGLSGGDCLIIYRFSVLSILFTEPVIS